MDQQLQLPKQPKHSLSFLKQLLAPFFVLFLLILATTAFVLYGRGNRLIFPKGEPPTLSKTGILHVTSNPTGAQVSIDGHLTTATESTLDLTPGEHTIIISKDDYFPWKKTIRITQEQVTNADASLFPTNPRLDSVATAGVYNPVMDSSGTKIAFEIASQSAKKNGIYVLNMNSSGVQLPVLTQSSLIQIADETLGVPFSTATLTWSPDSSQLLATITPDSTNQQQIGTTTYLLQTNALNDSPQDITAILSATQDAWTKQEKQREQARLVGIKTSLKQMMQDNFNILAWSPDDTKILYEASRSATLPLIIKPRLPGINDLPEKRSIQKGTVYVYDLKEDTNFAILAGISHACNKEEPHCQLPLMWLPNSSQLLYVNNRKIIIMDYDASNNITVYAGPFVGTFVVPWPDGSKLVILTNLDNPDVPITFYTIGLK